MRLRYHQVLRISKRDLIKMSDEEVKKRYERLARNVTMLEGANAMQNDYMVELKEAYSHLDTQDKRKKYYKMIMIEEHTLLGISGISLANMTDEELEEAYEKADKFYAKKIEEMGGSKDASLLEHCREVLLPEAYHKLETKEKREEYLGELTYEDMKDIQNSSVKDITIKRKKSLGEPIWSKFDEIGRELKLYLLGRVEYTEINRQDYLELYSMQRRKMNFQGKTVDLEELKFFTKGIEVSRLDKPEYANTFQQMLSQENVEKMERRARIMQAGATEEGIYLGSIEDDQLVFSKEEFAVAMRTNLGRAQEREKEEKQKGEN